MRGGEKFNIRENRERKIEYKVEETQDKLDNKKDKKKNPPPVTRIQLVSLKFQ